MIHARCIVPLAVIALAAACAEREERGCHGDGSQARRLAGEGAIDCGVVMLGADPSVVDACVLDAFRRGRAFFARYDRPSIDSRIALFPVFRDGTYWEVSWDTLRCSECGPPTIARVCSEPIEAEPTPPSPPADGGTAGSADPAGPPLSCATEPDIQTLCE